MSYTPEQIAEACAAADSFCATPAKNTLSVRKLRVLAEIVREQVAIIEQQREQIADLSGKLDYAFIAADKAEQELLAQRDRITALEAKVDLACAALKTTNKEYEKLRALKARDALLDAPIAKARIEQLQGQLAERSVCDICRQGSSLREEIKKLQAPAEAHAPTYVKALASVLAVIDAHEQKSRPCKIVEGDHSISGEKWCGTHTQWHEKCHKPSDERPARERMRAWAADNRNGDEAPMVLAIVEAIDANTAAIKEAKHG